MHTYLIWLILFELVPLILLWLWQFKLLRKFKLTLTYSVIGSIIFGWVWDFISIQQKVWFFSHPYIVGIWIAGLPLEEYLFIIFTTLLVSTITIIAWNKIGEK